MGEFIDGITAKAEKLAVGDPLDRSVYLGPLIDQHAVERFGRRSPRLGRPARSSPVGRCSTMAISTGNFVQPTVVTAPGSSWIWKRSLRPLVAVTAVDDMDEGLARANDTEYGLTAGFYSRDQEEIDRFLTGIEAGVVYINRRAGATTGAWPAVQPFGGWKGSGTSGAPAAGLITSPSTSGTVPHHCRWVRCGSLIARET